eukprot:330437_1
MNQKKKIKEMQLKHNKEKDKKHRKIKGEKLKKHKKIDMEINKIENDGNVQKNALLSELEERMNILEQEFEEKEIKIFANIEMFHKQKECEWNTKREDMKSNMMMNVNEVSESARFEANTDFLQENEQHKQKLMLEIKKLCSKQKSFEENINSKMKKIKNIEQEIEILNENNNNNNDLLNKINKIRDDIFEIGSQGEISEKGGCEFYVCLNDERFGFKGMLYHGDNIVLLSKKGYRNIINDDVLSVKVMVSKSKSVKYLKEVGYVKLIATSFFSKRTVNDF